MISFEIKKLIEAIKDAGEEIRLHQLQLTYLIEKLQTICPHENVVELPGVIYDGIAATYARRFCKVCKLEESARDLNGQFANLKHAHKIVRNINSAVQMAEYLDEKDK